ncbi:cytochrome C [Ferrimonas marina]|uniref:Redox-active protein (C_GCAxxG_C_C) n=1 Tax=Ferrimonas marina TaxID=299255 RepID=A0A1M5NX65_9GAMM|nr:cytochrome C [Ferrimonas marina]SHG94112.1 hypothetical protein SAMN02745129_1210 [Ferrimonas marina]
MDRRQAITKIIGMTGASAGALMLSHPALAVTNADGQWQLSLGESLAYAKIDPMVAARNAYEAGNGCMYQVFHGIVSTLAQSDSPDADKFAQIPTAMAQYGYGGILGEGTICGNINAAGMLLNFLSINGEPAKTLLMPIGRFYEETVLPFRDTAFLDGIGANTEELIAKVGDPTIANSPLCHASVTNWAKANGKTAKDKGERCSELSASLAYQIALMLNQAMDGEDVVAMYPFSDTVSECKACHTPADDFGHSVASNMECDTCHGGH